MRSIETTTPATPMAGPHGYTLPLSPSGGSAMVTPPPWHFSGDVIMVDYRVDPAAAARFLPPELEPGPDPGEAAAIFAEWQWCSESGAELADPARCRFAEFLILISCRYRGRHLARCPYAWVDSPVPLMRGWIQGMPKQFGTVHQIRPVAVGRAGPRLAGGGRFGGVLSVDGRRTAEATVTLDGRIDRPPPLHTVPLVHTRLFPSWVPSEAPLNRLVVSEVTDIEFSDIWAGSADLRLLDVPDADLAGLAPVEVGRGYVFSYAETLHHGRPLTDDDR
ncbi:enduracididine biosynthesis enzyme MppR [Streptosporangium amethystogenes subsp. fukuiense]|uniref:Enduracididine biosynthesis enzyme MppR n=1 Tax=Streptosporangium amethystogenes subsp. fukuiense TaxID=698418 RepID=A0ABW2ST09_9ACTN